MTTPSYLPWFALRLAAVLFLISPTPLFAQAAPQALPAAPAAPVPQPSPAIRPPGAPAPAAPVPAAAVTPTPAPVLTPAAAVVPGPEPLPDRIQLEPLSESIVHVTTSSGREGGMQILRLGDTLTLDLAPGGVDRLRARSKAKRQDIGLFLDGFYIKGIEPRRDPASPDRLIFVPVYKEIDKPAWNEIFLYRENDGGGLSVSVGFPDGEMAHSTFKLRLLILPHWQVLMSSLLALLLLGGLYYVGRYTSMLRDGTGITGSTTDVQERTFSLGRSQMAWWTALVIWAFLFLYLFTGSVQLTQSVVILIGLGAGTALGAIAIDKNKNIRQVQQVQQQVESQAKVIDAESKVLEVERKVDDKAEAVKKIEQKIGQDVAKLALGEEDVLPMPKSKGLLLDLLSDAYGVSLPRVQTFLWTLVLSVVFVRSVLTKLGMPDFDNTLLALMGVSSGTYLGFKIPEKPPGRT
jgi:uncharacterized membrane-anchored protein YhcB (DUF1043 family)